jgi:hypothetical protein
MQSGNALQSGSAPRRWLRRLFILLPPVLLFLLECRHPVPAIGETPWQTIQGSDGWWLQLHILQLFLFCGLGLSVLGLIATAVPAASVLPLLCSISVFLTFYSVLDAITGIASGLVVEYASVLSAPIQLFGNRIVIAFLGDPFVGGGSFSVTGILGGGGWLVSMILLAHIAKRDYQINRWVVALLVVSGVSFGLSHLPPTGPIGMLCYLIACIAILVRQSRISATLPGLAPAKS